ncbi:MAG TPA: type 1 glutamine amidotransferase domain-containing protein, partial [Actinomycetes bacterium]
EPRKAVEQAGADAELISLQPGEIEAWKHFDKGDRFPVDKTVDQANADDYDALVLPGGVANPDQLRMNPKAVAFTRAFFESGKPVGVICHGPWTLIEADVLRGRTITSWPSLKTDLHNAGANWVDEECVTDAGLTSSRKPDDLPAFCAKIVEEFGEGVHREQAEKTAAIR